MGGVCSTHGRDKICIDQWFQKCVARPPGGARDPQGGHKKCETILFTKNK
jgi:hypothetical protein